MDENEERFDTITEEPEAEAQPETPSRTSRMIAALGPIKPPWGRVAEHILAVVAAEIDDLESRTHGLTLRPDEVESSATLPLTSADWQEDPERPGVQVGPVFSADGSLVDRTVG